MTTTYSWIVGSGGLLGSSVTRELGRRGNCVFTSSVPWADHESARNTLLQDCTAFFGLVGDGAWNIVWAAGAGVNGTSAAEFAQENALIAEVLDQVGDLHTSAGGVYAGAVGAPHHEGTRAVPLGDYGRAKLDSEKIAEAFGIRTGINVVVGRFANLYGPGQNLSKPQGLISHLCRGYLMASPVSIYVPMDTLRDYLFVSDAAEMVADALALSARNSFSPTTKIFRSGSAFNLAAIIDRKARASLKRISASLAVATRRLDFRCAFNKVNS